MHIGYFASLKDTDIETELKKQTFIGKKYAWHRYICRVILYLSPEDNWLCKQHD